MVTGTRLRYLADVNPPSRAFDRLAETAEVTFMPLEAVWADSRLDVSRRRVKADVGTGYVRFELGDVLVPKVTPTFQAGRSALMLDLANGVGAGSTEIHVLRPRGDVDGRYVRYATQSQPFLTEGVAAFQGVAGLQRVPEQFVRDFPLPVVTLAEQGRIANFLDDQVARLDRAIALRQEQVRLSREGALAQMLDVLSGRTEVGDRQSTGWKWMPTIPASWSTGPVYAYFDVRLGKMLNAERAAGPNPKPYLRNANVHWFDINIDDLATMSIEPGERERYAIRRGDLMICEGGAGVAEAAVWDLDVECYYQKSLHRARAISHVPVQWLMYWLRVAKTSGVFESEGNLATIPHLTGEQIRESHIPVPPIGRTGLAQLQEAVDAAEDLQRACARSLDLLVERKQALITAAVTCEFDASTARGVA